MGLGGISIWQLLIVLVIVALLFGTKKLRTLGGDLGSAIRGFKNAIHEGEEEKSDTNSLQHNNENQQKQSHKEHDTNQR